MNADDRIKLLSLHNEFEGLFYGTLGEWYIYYVYIELNPGAKTVHSKYYLVPSINK